MNKKVISALFIGMMINILFVGINTVDTGEDRTSFSDIENEPASLLTEERIKETNYNSIPVTRSPPDAPEPKGYEPVIYEPFSVQKVYPTADIAKSTSRSINKIYVLVDSSIYSSLETYLTRYASDLENWTSYTAVIYQGSWGSPQNVRTFLQGELSNGMVGASLVGDIPAAWFEIANDFGQYEYAQFPIDLFYADLDGNWIDAQTTPPMQAGVYDDHTGTVAPDIFVGRLKASGLSAGSEVALLQNYFDKNHAYRIGMLSLPNKALVYIDDDWIPWADEWSNNVGVVYSDRTLVKDGATTNAADYKNRLVQGYEWIHLAAHSTATGHALAPGSVSYSDITNIDPHCLFYNLFCCSAARYTETNCIGSTYIFTNTYGLGVVGSTKTGGMLNLNYFYDPLETKTIGESFKDWFTASGESDRSWFYGMTVLGDITLKPKQKPAGVTINTPNRNEIWAGGATKWINFTISGGEAPYICWINYSTDGGNTWYAHNTSNVFQTGTYNWSLIVWHANSTSCRVNITLQNSTDLWVYDINDANFTIDSSSPTSNIEPNFPYCWNKPPPLLITATASDIVSGVKEVELWYRYSQNNVSWSSWSLFSTDKDVPWQWNFIFPNGKGYYEFYTKAIDNAENYENEICVLMCYYTYSLTLHPPIYINNNNFTSTNGVVSGTGILEDPYIIENWYITAETANGINIENTDAYFIIKNCIICDGKSNDKMGIRFYNVKNGEIENVTSYNNYIGITFYTSSNNEIINCSIYYNSYGIFLYGYDGEYINITTNQIYNNNYGIWQSYSLNTKIHYNNIYNNTNYGIYNYNSETTYQANATNNWWGSTSGPGGVGPGSGDNISANVLYDPWLTKLLDFLPPTIELTQPSNGTTDVPVDAEIVITFSEPMNIVTIPGNITIGHWVQIQNYVWSNENKTLTLTLDFLSSYTQYIITINTNVTDGILDSNGFVHSVESMGETYQFSFRTKDVTPPVADAGPDQWVDEDTIVTFDGSGSTDNVGIDNYTWTFMYGTLQTLYGVTPSYTFNTPGTYVVTLNVTDNAGNWAVDVINITVEDITPPTILNISPLTGTKTTKNAITVSGKTESDATVKINGVVAPVLADGSFSKEIMLVKGENSIVITATDQAGNTNQTTITVKKISAEWFPPATQWIAVLVGIIVIALIAGVFVLHKKKIKMKARKSEKI